MKPTAARDVPPGQSWAFHDHRTMREIMQAERDARRAGSTAERATTLPN